MKTTHIPFKDTGYFSKLICDYLEEKESVTPFYGNFHNTKGFKKQLQLKATFAQEKRNTLIKALNIQYKNTNCSTATSNNITALSNNNTFTVTTGHQLNIFTGPLYFFYKIIDTINTAKKLQKEFPSYHFVPVFWMASEDHDFEEINHFNYKDNTYTWDIKSKGAVGRLRTKTLKPLFDTFSKALGDSENAQRLKELFEKSYLENATLARATRYLVNELFAEAGLVIVDGDCNLLKQQLIPVIQEELLQNTAFKAIGTANKKLKKHYKIQVNPREINLFYLKDNLRERIVFKNEKFEVNNTVLSFSQEEIIGELNKHPERFSPNVVLRPVYQETVLPNLCYIGGSGELAYWLQLKEYFAVLKLPFPILLLRNSVVLLAEKQLVKMKKLGLTFNDLFLNQNDLIAKKVKEKATIPVDFSEQRKYLQQQFTTLKEMAQQTDASFIGAVNAQEKKQLNGLDTLEKRLLKAEKRSQAALVDRIKLLQNQLFPNQSLQERQHNFSEYYLAYGHDFVKRLQTNLTPLDTAFIFLEL